MTKPGTTPEKSMGAECRVFWITCRGTASGSSRSLTRSSSMYQASRISRSQLRIPHNGGWTWSLSRGSASRPGSLGGSPADPFLHRPGIPSVAAQGYPPGGAGDRATSTPSSGGTGPAQEDYRRAAWWPGRTGHTDHSLPILCWTPWISRKTRFLSSVAMRTVPALPNPSSQVGSIPFSMSSCWAKSGTTKVKKG